MTRRDWLLVLLFCALAAGCIFALVSPAHGQTTPPRGQDRVWQSSLGVLAAASAADLASSVGHREANPLLRGRDGRFSPVRAVVVKVAPLAGVAYMQHRVPWRGWKWVNFAGAGVFGVVAVRNWRQAR
jgi:drug/metabolite transporter (DMT)-like permease